MLLIGVIICCFYIWGIFKIIGGIIDFIHSLSSNEDFRLAFIPFLVYGFIVVIFLYGVFLSCKLLMFIGVLLFISICIWFYIVNRRKYKEDEEKIRRIVNEVIDEKLEKISKEKESQTKIEKEKQTRKSSSIKSNKSKVKEVKKTNIESKKENTKASTRVSEIKKQSIIEIENIVNREYIKSGGYVVDYVNENEFRKLERGLKKCNMLAYKKLIFEYYPSFRDGKFIGVMVRKNDVEGCEEFKLKLPTDSAFAKVYGVILLHYTVYYNQKRVELKTITPNDILNEASERKELSTYKGVPVSKSHSEKDMFKINLLNILEK